jgi:hypothetical protein
MPSVYESALNFSLMFRKSLVTAEFKNCDQSRMDSVAMTGQTRRVLERTWLAFLLHETVELTLPSEEEGK